MTRRIYKGFVRWDRAHIPEFQLGDGTRIGTPGPEMDDDEVLDENREHLSNLKASQQFIYVFDYGDDWTHLCTVVEADIDPHEVLGVVPIVPLPYFGWENIPDQYGRASAEEDTEGPTPLDPELRDLPPIRPGWGPKR
jgi:hypothetical protein